MEDYQILDIGNPTPQQLHDWGYDEDLYLTEQDEDLLLHNLRYVPTLLDLAADPRCPKQQYAADIITYYSQLTLLRRIVPTATGLAQVAQMTRYPSAPLIEKWRDWYLWLYELLLQPRPISTEEMERIAFLLAVGDCCTRDLKRTGQMVDGYTEFLASTSSFRLYVYINSQTGYWKANLYSPLNCITSH